MKRYSSATRLALPFLAVLALAGPVAAGEQVPFKGRLEGDVTITPLDPPYVQVDVDATGNATHLGRFSLDIPHVVNRATSTAIGSYEFTAANGDKATFGSIAVSASGTPSGAQEYQDHGPAADLNVHSTAVLAVVCSGTRASVFGTATINGSGSFSYRIDLTDTAEPGIDADKYRIRLSTGYDSGEQTLIGGNIQLHK